MIKIARKEAIKKKLIRYFTGLPCKYGHISERKTHSGSCCECNKIGQKLDRISNPDKWATYYKTYIKKHPERRKETYKKYRASNREAMAAKQKQYYLENPNKLKEKQDKYRISHAEEIRFRARTVYAAQKRANIAKRRAFKLGATPKWLTQDHKWMIKEIYELAKDRTDKTRLEWEVDHVVPLQGEAVCGLHVPWNMQVITAKANRSKGNRYGY